MKTIEEARLTEILPESLLRDAQIKAAAALDAELERLTEAAQEVLHLPRLEELSGTILDLLGWQFHVENWEPLFLSEAVKRNLIRQSVAWHRQKGTRAAVEAVCAAFSREIKIEEFWEYGGEPFHFRVTTKPFLNTADQTAFIRRLNDAKNVRSWVDVRYEAKITFNAYVGIARWKHGTVRRKMTDEYDVGRLTTTIGDGERTLIISATQVIIRYGDDEEIIDMGSAMGDMLRVRFAAPGGDRVLTIENPREDLTVEEVHAVADFATENEILLDAEGKVADTTRHATIITTTTQVLF